MQTSNELMSRLDEQGILPLVYAYGLSRMDSYAGLNQQDLTEKAQAQAAEEALKARQIRRVLTTLAEHNVHPVLTKGTALAYGVYSQPVLRPRCDTDLLIPREKANVVRELMTSLGYTNPNQLSVFPQFIYFHIDDFGVQHVFDFHTKISNRHFFEDLFTYDEVQLRSQKIPALGPSARGLCRVDALILACVHPVMHHYGSELLIWLYDIHLLVSQMKINDLHLFVERAHEKGVARICQRGLGLAQKHWQTDVPLEVIRALDAPDEGSQKFLAIKKWQQVILHDIKTAPSSWRRWVFIKEILFPSAPYMYRAFGVEKWRGRWLLLPALHVVRAFKGVKRHFFSKRNPI